MEPATAAAAPVAAANCDSRLPSPEENWTPGTQTCAVVADTAADMADAARAGRMGIEET